MCPLKKHYLKHCRDFLHYFQAMLQTEIVEDKFLYFSFKLWLKFHPERGNDN